MAEAKEVVTKIAFQNFVTQFKKTYDWDAPWGYKSNGTAITETEAKATSVGGGVMKNQISGTNPILFATNRDILNLF